MTGTFKITFKLKIHLVILTLMRHSIKNFVFFRHTQENAAVVPEAPINDGAGVNQEAPVNDGAEVNQANEDALASPAADPQDDISPVIEENRYRINTH
jgi:hypothetical protein